MTVFNSNEKPKLTYTDALAILTKNIRHLVVPSLYSKTSLSETQPLALGTAEGEESNFHRNCTVYPARLIVQAKDDIDSPPASSKPKTGQ